MVGIRWQWIVALAFCGLCACDDPCDGGGVTATSEHGLLLTADDHSVGWTKDHCEACHPIVSIHRQGCSVGVDLKEVRAIVDQDGYASCVTCHGTNQPEDTGR